MMGLFMIGNIVGVAAALYFMTNGNIDFKLLIAVVAGWIGGGYLETAVTGSSL